MPTAAEAHDAMVAAVAAQQARLRVIEPGADVWRAIARRFRADPRRELDPVESYIASLVEPADSVLDVGGGAGRIALPLSLRCRDVTVVDPSPGMQAEFDAQVAESGIANAHYLRQDWLEAPDLEADVWLAAHVTYFVPDIAAFVRKLDAAARRRVVIAVAAVPPPNASSELFAVIYSEEQALVPGHRELLPVLWEMGFLPEVRVLSLGPGIGPAGVPVAAPTREAALEASAGRWQEAASHDRAIAALDARFDELFVRTEAGYERRLRRDARQLVITWEKTGG